MPRSVNKYKAIGVKQAWSIKNYRYVCNVSMNKEELFPENKPGMLKLTDEIIKEASKSIKEKGIKTSHVKELPKMGVKLPIDQPYFPIQVNVVCPMEGIEKLSPTIEVSYVNNFAYHNNPEEHYIRMNLMKNSHKIKSLRENLSANVDAIKRLVKHCEMMKNQVDQMISLQNQLYENFIEKKQVCGVNIRGGASTQDPDFPDDHPKRKEQDALKRKSSAGKSPNENEDNRNS
jgi:hypothetical protein